SPRYSNPCLRSHLQRGDVRHYSIVATKTSTGYDDISAKPVKLCAEELRDPLVDITNKSFASVVFPLPLKVAKVYPKYKKGPTTEPANYRPIFQPTYQHSPKLLKN
ncbi:hypothetical protein J6590_007630, partial [Homalodisca vitripennis]